MSGDGEVLLTPAGYPPIGPGYRGEVPAGEREDRPDRSFSIVALVWGPASSRASTTSVTWCAFGVIHGVEHEELFDAVLNLIGRNEKRIGASAVSRRPATSAACATPAGGGTRRLR